MLREDRGLSRGICRGSRGLRRGGRRLGRGPCLSGESRRKRKRWRQTPRREYQDAGEDQYENRAEIETENGARATTSWAEVETRVSRRRSRRRALRRRGSRRRSKRGMRQLSPFVFVLGLRVLFSQHLVLVLESLSLSSVSDSVPALRVPPNAAKAVTELHLCHRNRPAPKDLFPDTPIPRRPSFYSVYIPCGLALVHAALPCPVRLQWGPGYNRSPLGKGAPRSS